MIGIAVTGLAVTGIAVTEIAVPGVAVPGHRSVTCAERCADGTVERRTAGS